MKLKRVLHEGGLPSFHNHLRAAAARIVGWGQAEEVVQECYIKELRLDEERDSLKAWLKTMVRNRAIDRYRSEVRAEEVAEQYLYESGLEVAWHDDVPVNLPGGLSLLSPKANPEEGLLMVEQVEACMGELTGYQKRLHTLVVFGYGQKLIAAILDISQPTVSRSVARVQEVLDKCNQQFLPS